MLSVSLHNIHIHAPVGLYSQEQILHNRFEVDIDVSTDLSIDNEWPLIDYTSLNTIVQHVFLKEEKLLENIVKNIFNAIKAEFPFIQKIKIKVRKLNPPMQGNVGYAQVAFES
jgi:7,8-dihydroneopterin aldolase/epimerase/oxygenase